ncbi:MAG: SDR family oxidoreductase [Oscillospiraceae bacterium]|nr:SDR family oxidoreductase [Oscillospiraceae bacterium]
MDERKTATLVVGADSDIGAAVVQGLGGTVLAHYCLFEDKLSGLAADGREIVPVRGDLSSEEGIGEFIAAVEAAGFDVARIVHLPSAPAKAAHFKNFDPAVFRRDFNISVLSAALVCRAFAPAMAKRRFGRVVFMLTSYNLGVPPKFLANYVTCKYALEGLMKSLAAEYADKNVTFNGVAPSMVQTKFLSTLPDFAVEQNARENPTGRNATPADVAPAVLYLLRDGNEFTTGAVLPVTGGSIF